MSNRTNRIFEVTLPGYKTMYVESDTLLNAVSVAKRYRYALDKSEENTHFSCEEKPKTVKPYMNRILTPEGMKWFDEYITELEEQETEMKDSVKKDEEEKNRRAVAVAKLVEYTNAKGRLVKCDFTYKTNRNNTFYKIHYISTKSRCGCRLCLCLSIMEEGCESEQFWVDADKEPASVLEHIIDNLQGKTLSDDILTFEQLRGLTDSYLQKWHELMSKKVINEDIVKYASDHGRTDLLIQTVGEIEIDDKEKELVKARYVRELEKRYSLVSFKKTSLQEFLFSDSEKLHEYIGKLEARLDKKRKKMKTEWDRTLETSRQNKE